MIKNKVKSSKGITLTTLSIAVIILILLSNIIIYQVKENLKLVKLKEMQNDIDNLRNKISLYDTQHGTIPAKLPYPHINHLKEAGIISEAIDKEEFLVIDLSALDSLTLSRGKDYEQVKTFTSLSEEQAKNYTDLYIISKASHNIFYVAGINVDGEIFYTDYTAKEIDRASVNLRYVEGIKIPDDFYYVTGTKNMGILIQNSDKTKRYRWQVIENQITQIPEGKQLEDSLKEDFIKSVNANHGYYESLTNNEIMYLPLENWSPVYDKEAVYQDKNGDTAYIPQDFQVSLVTGQNTIDEGLVVKDSNGNEWIWIEVPKNIYQKEEYNEGNEPIHSEDYEKIETILQKYTNSYREENYEDIFFSTEQHGFQTSEQYDNYKNAMLKSVFEKGGFYIGRYEAGNLIARDANSGLEDIPVIQKNMYPYNFVTCLQAQTLANQLSTSGKSCSLMFGIQWDLVLKFIESKTAKSQSQLNTNSDTWGNYQDVSFDLVKGHYNEEPNTKNTWKQITNFNKTNDKGILLTTGSTDRNSTLNIYDLAGNVYEWTLEYSSISEYGPSVIRGGNYNSSGNATTSAFRLDYYLSTPDKGLGFRPALW